MKTTILSSALLAGLCLLLSTSLIQAQSTLSTTDIPRTISYQGALTGPDGSAVTDGTYQITVALYADPTGLLKVWQDTYAAPVTGGVFNLHLGSGNVPIPDPGTMNTSLWIGTRIGDSPEMYPLTPLSASPYALNVSDKAITTGKLADGAVTAEKVSMDYIAGVEVNNERVTGAGAVLKLKSSDDITLDYDETTNSITIASNQAQSGSDAEKGGTVQDAIISATNWLGRDTGPNLPFFNIPYGSFNTLAGGEFNSIGAEDEYSAIVGGWTNTINVNSNYSFIGGGQENTLDGHHNVIGGGAGNTIHEGNLHSSIAGGSLNTLGMSNQYAFIGGGSANSIGPSTSAATLGGGQGNSVTAHQATLGGGIYNVVSGLDGALVGGRHNEVLGEKGFIGGGNENKISGNSNYNVIGGGDGNEVWVSTVASAVVGGVNNHVRTESDFSTVGGGHTNFIGLGVAGGGADYATIGGGHWNLATADYSTVPGGDNLGVKSYAQTAVGYSNAPRGALDGPLTAAQTAASNDPLFMVGNGDRTTFPFALSNAFEVSYNGHSVVYDVNGAVRDPIRGATYVDNILYAWGDVNGDAMATINSEFGIAPIIGHVANSGVYVIDFKVVYPTNGAAVILTGSSVTATIRDVGDATPCAFITASNVTASPVPGLNRFTVRIRDRNCAALDAPFMFKVTGRP